MMTLFTRAAGRVSPKWGGREGLRSCERETHVVVDDSRGDGLHASVCQTRDSLYGREQEQMSYFLFAGQTMRDLAALSKRHNR